MPGCWAGRHPCRMPEASSGGGFSEPLPELISPNPGGSADPLGESVLDLAQPWLRIFEPCEVRVVIGRHQDPRRECQIEACQADGVPIHRRVAGGGTVVLAPGMVVVAARLQHTQVGTTCYFEMMNDALIPGVPRSMDRGNLDEYVAVHDDGKLRIVL